MAEQYRDRFEELNAREQEFILRYEETLDPYNSALAAGYSRENARKCSYSWMRQPHLKPAMYETAMFRKAKRLEAHHVTAEELKHRTWLIATADPNELIEYKRINCRHCHGEGFGYQWKEHEFEAAVAQAERPDSKGKTRDLPDIAGGFGFTVNLDPHPDCPHCDGNGEERIFPKDTRDLSEAAKALYKGVKMTKNGLEILMHDQDAARRFYAELCGYKIDRKELTGKNGAPLVEMPTQIVLVAQLEALEDESSDS